MTKSILKRCYGHESAEKAWLDAMAQNKLHHAWLIVGDKGIGKGTLARKIAAFMLDSDNPNALDLEISSESHHLAKLLNGSHPDAFMLESEKEVDGEISLVDIKVDDVRKLTQFLSFTPVLSKNKIAIIDAIDDMNTNAANALLKFLEEPTKNTYFLLVCNSLNSILPTIRSRCRILKLKPPSKREFTEALKSINNKMSEDDCSKLYNITSGSLYYATKLLESKNANLLEKISEFIKRKTSTAELLDLSKTVSDNETFEIFSYLAAQLSRERIKFSTSKYKDSPEIIEHAINCYDKLKQLITSAKNANLDKTYAAYEALLLLKS